MFPRQDRDTTGVYSRSVLSGTGTTGSVAKMRLPGSISRATALNSPSPTASQRTDPAKSDVSAAGNAWSMSQDVCPLASRGMLAASSSTPSRIKSQRSNPGLDSRLWRATPVVIPPSWRRTGKLTAADTVSETDILNLFQNSSPEIAARASARYLAAREGGDKRLVLSHTISDTASNLMIAAKGAVDSYEGLTNNTNISNTALAQSQIAGTVTQGNLTAAMAQLMAYQAAKEAAEGYEREIERRLELARSVARQQQAEINFNAQQAGLDDRRDSMREGLLFRVHPLYGGSGQ